MINMCMPSVDAYVLRQNVKVVTHILHPLAHSSWINVLKKKPHEKCTPATRHEDDAGVISDDSMSTSGCAETNLMQEEVEEDKIVLDANREVRAKLFLGSVCHSLLDVLALELESYPL